MFIKIMNQDGKFSTGGMYANFTKKGKVWSALGYVKTHMRQYRETDLRRLYNSCTLVMIDDNNDYEKTETPMIDFINDFIASEIVRNKEKEISQKKSQLSRAKTSVIKYQEEVQRLEIELKNI